MALAAKKARMLLATANRGLGLPVDKTWEGPSPNSGCYSQNIG